MLKAIAELDGEGMPTDTVVMKQKPARRIRLANIFTGVLIGCIIGLLLFLGQPYLSRLIDRAEMPDDTSRSEDTRPADATVSESKKPFLDTIKQSLSNSADPAHLTDLIVKKDYSVALSYISQKRKDMPETGNEMMQKADRFLASKQYMNAGDIFNTVLSVEPKNMSALMGLLYVAIEKQQSVMKMQDPPVAEYSALLALLNKAIENTDAQYFKHLKIESVESVYENARRQMEQQNLEQAAIWTKTGLENAPDHLRLKKLGFLIQAKIRVEENRLTMPEQDNALVYYRKVLQIDPDDRQAKQGIAGIIGYYKTRALAAQKENDYGKAVELIEKALSITPDDPELQTTRWLILGDMYASKGEFIAPENASARYFYQRILEQSPQNKQAIMRLAKIELLMPLYQIRHTKTLSEKVSTYRILFSKLKSVAAEYGEENVADIKNKIIQQVKADIQNQKDHKEPIPAEFMTLVSDHFPDENEIFNTQYDILIAKGDQSTSEMEKAGYYLKALKLNPAPAPAKEKIKKVADDLDNGGKTNDAQAVLKQALNIVPNHAPFNKMYQAIKKAQDTKAEIFTLLLKIKRLQSLTEKVELYKELFSKTASAVKTFGQKKMTDLKKDVIAQVKSDIAARENSRQIIPPDFMSLLKNDFPELYDHVVAAQYGILIENADRSDSIKEKTDYYLAALKLDKQREEAKKKIDLLAKNLEKNGNNETATAVLKQALSISPNDLIFTQLFDKIKRIVEIYATTSGCGKKNMISTAPVSVENLNLCIQYRNLPSDSVVNVVLDQKNGHNMNIPVVLDGRSGIKSMNIVAPVEGFALGNYSISVQYNNKILSETLMQFTPKRR